VSGRLAVLVATVFAIAACGGSGPGSSPSPTPTITPSPTPSTTPTSAPSPTPTMGVMDLHFGRLGAGTYRSVGFDLSLTFTVENETWADVFDAPAIVKLTAQRNGGNSLIFGLPTGFFYKNVDLFESLHQQGATLSNEVPVTVDGLTGTAVEFVAPMPEDRPNYAAPDDFVMFFGRQQAGFEEGNGNYFAKVGDHIRVWNIDRGDGLLLILASAKSTTEYAVVLKMADELLATIKIE